MSKNEQKQKEKFHFELFTERYGEWRDGKVKHEVEQTPDFLIKYPDKVLGIEHTEPFKFGVPGQAVSPQHLEGSLQAIVSKAKILYEKHNNPSLLVDVWFNATFEKTSITKKKAGELSCRMAKFVEKEVLDANLRYFTIPKPEELPEVDKISITTDVPKHCIRWAKQSASWAKRDFADELQGYISEKNKKYDGYIMNCDECWLLMIADGSNPAQSFADDRNNKVFDHVYRSKFSKTFYLEVTGKPIELKTVWP